MTGGVDGREEDKHMCACMHACGVIEYTERDLEGDMVMLTSTLN